MSEIESEFDTLVNLHTEIKSFKIEKSAEILKNFHSGNQPKFKLTAEEKEEKFLFNIENKEDKEKLKHILTNFELSESSTGELREIFKIYRDKQSPPKIDEDFLLSNNVTHPKREEKGWIITDHGKNNTFIVIESDKELKIYIKKPSRLNLSSTAVCAYALSQYFELWEEAKKPEYKAEFPNLHLFKMGAELEDALNSGEILDLQDEFGEKGFPLSEKVNPEKEKENKWTIKDDQRIFAVKKEDEKLNVYLHFELTNYYNFIIDGLGRYLVDSKSRNTSELESTDEFSLLNVLSLLKGIQEKIKEENKDFEEGNDIVIEIIQKLCKQFIKNRFSSFGERPHPFIYYKFLRIIRDWAREIFDDMEKHEKEWTTQEDEEWGEFVKKAKEMKKDEKEKGSKAISDYFFSEAKIYDDAKYEMYRQIALYNAADSSLFDVKRLIYSLLIVKMNDKYSNNLIKDKVLKLIVEEQLDTSTGLFPIGHVVNTDFVIEGGEIKGKTGRIISASPILSSVECLKDMLTHEELKTDLEKYQMKLNSTYEWIIKRLRKDSPDKPLGWFPEYESTHTPESWVAGHTLVFLKRYCEMLSELIKKNAGKEFQAKEPDELDIEWENLYDSYNIKKYIGYMVKEEEKGKVISNHEYRSALIFGPPGSGKSTIVKALAKRLGWHYVELSPGIFFEGERNIIPNATKIFKRLVRMKETVIFFDEVDQLVKAREKGGESSIWIVTSLLPMFQELREQKDIKFILATNNITEVDTAARRPGRIDAVLPMGALCWQDRLKILRDAINDGNNRIKELRSNEPNEIFKDLLKGDELKNDEQIDEMEEDKIENFRLRKFLERTDFMPLVELKSIVERLFNKEDWEKVEKAESYKVLFGKEGSGSEEYENSEFEDFHENLVGKSKDKDKHVDKYVHLPMEAEISKDAYIQKVKKSIFGER